MSGSGGGDANSFESRMREARAKAGLDAPAAAPGTAKEGGEPSPLGVGLRVGIELVSALAVSVAIGYFLDRWLHTMPLFVVVFVVLGGVAGVLNVWRAMGPPRDAGPKAGRLR